MSKLAPDLEPINTDARRILSKGDPDRLKSVEEALKAVAVKMTDPIGLQHCRKLIEMGFDVKYIITIEKDSGPGFTVSLKSTRATRVKLARFYDLV